MFFRQSPPQCTRTLGFSLIEVLIGIAIAGIGLLGIIELQRLHVQSNHLAQSRLFAINIARDKIISTRQQTFKTIIATPTPTVTSISNHLARFNVSSIIENRYYINGKWQKTALKLKPKPIPDAKHIEVTVDWLDLNGHKQSVIQVQHIAATNRQNTPLLESLSLNQEKPTTSYSTLQGIENPIIPLFEVNAKPPKSKRIKASTHPKLIIAPSGNSQRVQFNIDTYTDTNKIIEREDFATVSCTCTFSAANHSPSPVTLKLQNKQLIIDENSGTNWFKEHGTNVSVKNDSLCTKCCNTHHDDILAPARFSAIGQDNHPHFSIGAQLATVNGRYDEVCRFKRVNGHYKAVPDWKLIALIVLPQSYFTEQATAKANNRAYANYVKDIVKSYLLKTSAPTPLLTHHTFTTGSHQLVSRGVFVDLASLTQLDIQNIMREMPTNNQWYELVPFYDINLTLFASWHSSAPQTATVTNALQSSTLKQGQYYQARYSRGVLKTITKGISHISASISTDNTAVTGSPNITPNTPSISASLPVTIK